jgi:ATP-dependent helicase/DNAse subunit B
MSHAGTVELRRLSRTPHDTYSGRLQHSALIAQAARFFENRLWSATQLNDYGICGFRFFAKRMLKLEPLAEPEDGLNAAQLGTLYHSILEHTYRDLAARGIAITRENMDTALQALERAAEAVFEDAPERIGFRTPALWREERDVLFRRLQALVRDDFDDESSFNEKLRALGIGERRPYRLEVPFGEGGVFSLDIGGETLRIRGVIDRIDRTDNQAIVIDYKSGSSEIPVSEIARGRNFQMMIYLLAARAAFAAQAQPPEVAGGVFWHIGTRKISGLLQSDDNEVIEAGKAHLRDYLARGRRGDFSADANKVESGKCSRYCDYSQLCRFAVVNRGKPHA